MKKIVIDNETLKKISKFTTVTKVVPKDCFETHEHIVFIVNNGDIGKAVGKKGINIPKVRKMMRTDLIRIVEYNEDVIEFTKSVCQPNKPDSIELIGDSTILLKTNDLKTRGYLIGKNASTLRLNEEIVKRYFNNIKEIKVQQIEA